MTTNFSLKSKKKILHPTEDMGYKRCQVMFFIGGKSLTTLSIPQEEACLSLVLISLHGGTGFINISCLSWMEIQ